MKIGRCITEEDYLDRYYTDFCKYTVSTYSGYILSL